MNFSLAIKFSAYAFLVAGLSILFTSILTYNDADSLMKQHSFEQLEVDLRRQITSFDQEITQMKDDVTALSRSESVRGYYRAEKGGGYDSVANMTSNLWKERLTFELMGVLRQRPEYLQVRFIGKVNNGKEIVRVDKKNNIQIVDETDLQEKGDSAYVKNTLLLNENEQYLSPVELNREYGNITFPLQPVIRVASPIFIDGEVLGMLIINADFNRLSKVFRNPPDNVSYFIADLKGDYLLHANREREFSLALGKAPRLLTDYNEIDLLQKTPEQFTISVLPKDSSDLLTLYHQIDPLNPSNMLIFGSIVSHLLIEQDSASFGQRMFVRVFISVLLLSIVMAFLSHRLLAPIKRLTQTANEVVNGAESVEFIDHRRNDEIGDLTRSFSTMYTHLDNSKTELKVFANNLEEQVKERTIELEKALIESQKSTQVKNEFLATMSHEIRTPMNGVLGMLGLLLNSKLNEEQFSRAKLALNSAESLLALINDILDFTKIDAGKMELELIEFNLPEMLGEFAETMAFHAQNKQLEIMVDTLHIEMPMVVGDPGRLRQILTNLVGNAIKFTEEGEITIKARLSVKDAKQWVFACSVIDTGIGIPEDKKRLLFESFTQVDASTTREYGGTGLGLAIAKKFCELMHGNIQVSSEVGRGSSFDFNVLLGKSTQSNLRMPSVDLSGLHILVADANKNNRAILSAQLTRWGAIVTEASSGEDALLICSERLKNSSLSLFNIAFLDMQIPPMGGKALSMLLNKNRLFAPMKLIVMRSMVDRGDAQYFTNLGFSGYFTKPATSSNLLNVLNFVINGADQVNTLLAGDGSQRLVTPEKQNNRGVNDQLPDDIHILLVEDNRVNQEVAKGILKILNVQVDVSANGVEALTALQMSSKTKPYSLIFMDCQMPEMDGYEATRQIRGKQAGDRYAGIPIVAMTANAMQGDEKKCLQAGMDDYLTKPINPDKIKKMLHKWLLS